MAEATVLSVEGREAAGSAVARRLRKDGRVPGVVYSEGGEAVSIHLDRHGFEQMLRHHYSENVVLDLSMPDGQQHKVLLKDVQHHPLTGSVMHIDFQAIAMNKTLRVEIAVELLGEPIGVKRDGGVMEQHMREVEVECLPGDIVESFEYDVSEMTIGDSVTVNMLGLDPAKYKLITDGEYTVANVGAPRVSAEDEAEGAAEALEGASTAEPVVLKERKEREDAAG